MDIFLGLITQFAFSYAPTGWLECAGQTLSISEYQALYSLLGTTFGGNGTTTFCLPDMRNASLYGPTGNPIMKYYIAKYGFYPPRD